MTDPLPGGGVAATPGASPVAADFGHLTGRAFCEAYTAAVDAWLVGQWERLGGGGGAALVGVGGHGRRELTPGSDLDLWIIRSGGRSADVEGFWYPLWDAGFQVGHAFRTVAETIALAEGDLETAMALVDLRHLAGDSAVTAKLAERAQAQRAKRGRVWLRALVTSMAARRERVGDVAHDLEPDLKEGRGGLRDRQALGWMDALGAPVDPVWFERTDQAYETLLAARVGLHLATKRRDNRLVLQEQEGVAEALGVSGPVELMTRVAAAAREIAWAHDEVVRTCVQRRRRGGKPKVVRSDPDLAGAVAIAGEDVVLTRPPEDARDVLRLAVVAAERGLAIASGTLVGLEEVPEIPVPWSPDARRLLVRLLMAGVGAIGVVESLDRTGAWTRVLPEWEPVRCRPQRNPYHRWTVDRHLLETVARAASLSGRVSRPDTLVLGALLHDIGKGYRGDHSLVGAEVAQRVCARMGLDDGQAAQVVSLVRDHLLLPDVATRRDIDDPATVRMCVERVGSVATLRLLAALSEADGRATGSSAWNAWKADLMGALVERVEQHFTAGGEVDADPSPMTLTAEQRELLASPEPILSGEHDRLTVVWPDHPGVFSRVAGVLALHGCEILDASVHSDRGRALEQIRVRTLSGDPPRWDRIVADLGPGLDGRLAIRARLAERAGSFRRRAVPGAVDEPRVTFEAATDATVVEVAAPDSHGLLYRLTGTLGELDLDIRRARVSTIGPDAVDTFYVVDRSGRTLEDPDHRAEIRRALVHSASSVR